MAEQSGQRMLIGNLAVLLLVFLVVPMYTGWVSSTATGTNSNTVAETSVVGDLGTNIFPVDVKQQSGDSPAPVYYDQVVGGPIFTTYEVPGLMLGNGSELVNESVFVVSDPNDDKLATNGYYYFSADVSVLDRTDFTEFHFSYSSVDPDPLRDTNWIWLEVWVYSWDDDNDNNVVDEYLGELDDKTIFIEHDVYEVNDTIVIEMDITDIVAINAPLSLTEDQIIFKVLIWEGQPAEVSGGFLIDESPTGSINNRFNHESTTDIIDFQFIAPDTKSNLFTLDVLTAINFAMFGFLMVVGILMLPNVNFNDLFNLTSNGGK